MWALWKLSTGQTSTIASACSRRCRVSRLCVCVYIYICTYTYTHTHTHTHIYIYIYIYIYVIYSSWPWLPWLGSGRFCAAGSSRGAPRTGRLCSALIGPQTGKGHQSSSASKAPLDPLWVIRWSPWPHQTRRLSPWPCFESSPHGRVLYASRLLQMPGSLRS